MHRSQAFIKQIPKWVKQGLIVKYLPSYSPELNRVCPTFYTLGSSASCGPFSIKSAMSRERYFIA